MKTIPTQGLRWLVVATLLLALGLGYPASAAAGEHRLGLGAHFWKTLDNLSGDDFDGIEDDGLAWVVSYQYIPDSLIKFELDVEYYDGGFAGSPDSALTPVAFVMVGSKLYGALGVGLTYSGGLQDDVSDPFFAGRVGYVLSILPGIRVDINANYRTGAFEDLGDADTDAITLGAILRFKL